jgi:hypothetical protein
LVLWNNCFINHFVIIFDLVSIERRLARPTSVRKTFARNQIVYAIFLRCTGINTQKYRGGQAALMTNDRSDDKEARGEDGKKAEVGNHVHVLVVFHQMSYTLFESSGYQSASQCTVPCRANSRRHDRSMTHSDRTLIGPTNTGIASCSGPCYGNGGGRTRECLAEG